MNPRLLIVGWGRSGKDEAARFFNDNLGVPYAGSTSWAALPLMAEALKTHPQLAWEHRHENRQFWKDQCDEFRRKNPLLLVERALSTPLRPAYSVVDGRSLGDSIFGRVVTGIRDRVEIIAAKEAGLFRNILWIDRYGVPTDPTVTFDASDATDYVRNDGDLRRFHCNLVRWAIQSGFPIQPSAYATELLLDPNPMIEYVLGFAFATEPLHANTYVALIEKLKPDWQLGKCNGIGGKVEDSDGHYYDAMTREFREETGVETLPEDWRRFAHLRFDSCRIHCYASRMDWEKFNSLWSPTPEQVIKVRADRIWEFKPLPNLSWLVPMAQAFLNDPNMPSLIISE